MDEAAVKSIFRQKLQTTFTKDLLQDNDIVGITLLIGYRMYLGKCQKDQAIRILDEAVNDRKIVKTLVNYFYDYTEESKKKAQEEKNQGLRKATKAKQQAKRQLNKKSIKPKPKQVLKEQAQKRQNISNQIEVPDPEKKVKQNQSETKQGEQKQQGEGNSISKAKQLLSQGKVRCKYFPFCKNQPCEYFHPSQKCPFFPRCRFGQSCMYLHESCKFAQNCTRSNCFYDHPFKKKLENPMVQLMKMAMGQMKPKRPIRKRKPTQDASVPQKPIEKLESNPGQQK